MYNNQSEDLSTSSSSFNTSGQYNAGYNYGYNYVNYQNCYQSYYGYPYSNQASNNTTSSPVTTQYYNCVEQDNSATAYPHYQYYNNYNNAGSYNLDSTLNSSYDMSYKQQYAASTSSNSIESSPSIELSIKTTSSSSLASASSKTNAKTETSKRATRASAHCQLPEEAVDILNDWFETHINHPYPTTEEKHRLSEQCAITVKQVNSWFCNRRNRSQNTKPKRIKRQLEQEIANVYNELVLNPNKTQVIEKFRSTLIMHDIGVSK